MTKLENDNKFSKDALLCLGVVRLKELTTRIITMTGRYKLTIIYNNHLIDFMIANYRYHTLYVAESVDHA